jgi:trimeric autotransporter adhesin
VNIYLGGSITGGNGGAKLVFPSTSYSGSFSTTGPFFYSNSGSGTGVLPMTLVSFNSSQQNQEVVLYWKTENEENINSFEIESGRNGNSDWQSIEMIPSMASKANGYSYTFIDHRNMDGDRYYRLKIIDRDGKYVYSKVLFIESAQTGVLTVNPTLVNSSMNVSLPASGPARVSIFNVSGQPVKTMTAGSEVFNIDVSGLNRGEYFLSVSQGKNFHTTKFFKQ